MMKDILTRVSILEAKLSRMCNKVMNGATRGTITKTDDAGGNQALNIRGHSDEEIEGAMRIESFGISSSTPDGSDCVVLFLNGDRSQAVILGTSSPSARKKAAAPGGTIIYDAAGSTISLDAGGNVVVTAAGTVTIKAATLKIEADIDVTGSMKISGGIVSGGSIVDADGNNGA